MLHEVKTTGTGLVWRTRPCGTEGTRHLKNPSFQYLTSLSDEPATIAKSYVEEKSIVQDLLQFQRRSNQTRMWQQMSAEAPVHLFNIKVLSVLSESAPDSLSPRIWKVSYAQTPTWPPLELVELHALTGCQLTCFNLSGNKKCHRSSCRVVSTFVQTLWLKTGWILRLVF